MIQVVFFAIWNVLVITDAASSLFFNIVPVTAGAGAAPPSAEAILGQALHMVMLVIIERPAAHFYLVLRDPFTICRKIRIIIHVAIYLIT